MSARPTRAAARRRKETTLTLYRITYGTPDSETETTNLTERSETAARKAFKASCKAFCSIIPDIIGIELIREDVGATKQQERDTLTAIMQMVEELGPNSYLATAFAGCFEDAEENIENDFAFSMKERYESSKKDADYFHEAANTFSNDLDTARDEIAAIKAELTDAQNRRIEAEASYNSLVDRTTAAEARAEAAEDEIVTLKAKLYDYITAGA